MTVEDTLMSDTTQIQEQQPAPDFTLLVEGSNEAIKDGKLHLADLRGRVVVLYFYPKDDWTPVKIGVYVISIRGWIFSLALFGRADGWMYTLTPNTSSALRFSWKVACWYFPFMTLRKSRKPRTLFWYM